MARGIPLRVKDPPLAVRRLLGECEFGAFLVELGPPPDELADAQGTFLDQGADRLPDAEAVARLDGVIEVDGDLVLVGQDHGHAALGVLGAALRRRVLGDHEDIAVPCELDGCTETGDTAADDEKVGRDMFGREVHHNCQVWNAEPFGRLTVVSEVEPCGVWNERRKKRYAFSDP